MTPAVGYLLDENTPGPLHRAILHYNRRPGALPIVADRVGDFPDLPTGSLDPYILEWAEREGRIVLTADWHTMIADFWHHIGRGRHSPGLFVLRASYRLDDVVEDLVEAMHAADPAEWADLAHFIPLRP